MSVVEDSALYDLEGFDIVWDVAIDVFHLCYEGITKLQLRRMFVVRSTVESRDLLEELNVHYREMRVFSETARTTRTVQVMAFKGNELAVFTLSVMPFLALKLMTRDAAPWSVNAQFLYKYLQFTLISFIL